MVSRAMTSYRVGRAAELLGVSPDTVRRWADTGRLAARREGGERVIDGADLARLLTETAPLADTSPVIESARNRFPGIVTQVEKEGLVAVVHLQAGPHRITSMMTPRSGRRARDRARRPRGGRREVDERGRGSPAAGMTDTRSGQ